MANYDFVNLSPYDFELLVRDLLQAELGITIESFKVGQDQGIDLRYAASIDDTIIVQCKRYSGDKFSNLKANLEKEKHKVEELEPQRYIIATSMSLSPMNKDKIFDIFPKYIKRLGDILGNDDINNLIQKFPKIERDHFKLWISSTEILNRMLRSTIFSRSLIEMENLKQEINVLVTTQDLYAVHEILEERRHCVILGIPGVGKTTLAKMLSFEYFKNGYDVFKVNSIDEVNSIVDPDSKQFFYYDDFLGDTRISLGKNEADDLASFIKYVRRSENKRFVMTSRDYLLNKAKDENEKFNHHKIDVINYKIHVDRYSLIERAKILYNHLYYMSIPKDYKENILKDRNYMRIINHENFIPRVISTMSRLLEENEINPNEFTDEIVIALNNPSEIWGHTFRKHISPSSQNLLTLLVTLPKSPRLDVLRDLYFRSFPNNTSTTKLFEDFNSLIKEIEGTFITLEGQNGGSRNIYVTYYNPSVKDFIEGYIYSHDYLINQIIVRLLIFEQIEQLYSSIKEEISAFSKDVSQDILELYFNQAYKILNLPKNSFNTDNYTLEYGYHFILLGMKTLRYMRISEFSASLLRELVSRLLQNKCEDDYHLIEFLVQLQSKTDTYIDEMVFNNAIEDVKKYIIFSLIESKNNNIFERFSFISSFSKRFKGAITESEHKSISIVFTKHFQEYGEDLYYAGGFPAFIHWLKDIFGSFDKSCLPVRENIKSILINILRDPHKNFLRSVETEQMFTEMLLDVYYVLKITPSSLLKNFNITNKAIRKYFSQRREAENSDNYDDLDYDDFDYNEFYEPESDVSEDEIESLFDVLLD